MRTRLLFPLLTTAACLAAAVPASAATNEAVSENWAGYEAAPNSSYDGSDTTTTGSDGSDFSAVSGSWTQPKVSCTAGTPTYSAYWVGLGGGSEQSDALEQIGTQADCSATGNAKYYAWYELVPKAPVNLKLAIKPGDQISARTAVNGTNVTVTLSDSTTGQSVTKTLKMSDPDTSTAEWIAEAPSECQGDAASECTPLSLADFGKVTFTNARATADGHTGGISNSSYWTSQAIALSPESDGFTGPGYGGYGGGFGGGTSTYGEAASADSSGGASPSKLSDKGRSFTVSYSDSTSSSGTGTGTGQTSTTSGSGSGAGDGYGYGTGGSTGYGYGGYGDAYGYGGYGGGYGDAYGYGGYGDGYGDLYGYSYGSGDSYGDAYGYGDGVYSGGSYSVYGDETYGGDAYGSGGWVFSF